jgi:hypothetical protein
MQRVGQAHLPVGDRDRHQPGPFQRLQHPGRSGRLQVAEFNRLAQGQQIHDRAGLGRQTPDPLLDQVDQPIGGRQGLFQVPHS